MGTETDFDRGLDTRARFRHEVKRSTRVTGISAGAVASIAVPAWTAFDYLVEPSNAPTFLYLRLLLTVPLVLLTLTLAYTRFGQTKPETLLLAMMVIVQLGLSLMLAEVETHYAAYALGMSLTVYGGAFLLIWPPSYMAALVLISFAELTAVFLLTDPIETDAIATVSFYYGTAATIGFLGQLHRERMAWREFQSLEALRREQERSSELVRELDRQSHEDSLTGLANRRAWDKELDRECARSARDGSGLAILLCDLDCLKEINDRLGHPVGDIVLKTVGSLLRDRTRAGDLVARIGGDEFAILSSGDDLLGATELAEHLRRLVADESSAAAGIGGVTISIGVADWEGGDDSRETLMLRADRRLYTAKTTRNVVCAGDPRS